MSLCPHLRHLLCETEHEFNINGICIQCGLEDESYSTKFMDFTSTVRCVPRTKYSITANFTTILRSVISTDLLCETLRDKYRVWLDSQYSKTQLSSFVFDDFANEMTSFIRSELVTTAERKKLKVYYLKWSILYNSYYYYTGNTFIRDLFTNHYELMNQMRIELTSIICTRVNNRTLMYIMASMILRMYSLGSLQDATELIRLKNKQRERKDLLNIIRDFDHHSEGANIRYSDLMSKFYDETVRLCEASKQQ